MKAPVLVVEDRRSLAAMLLETLQREGYAVEVCHRGDEAVARLHSQGPYLAVLTDLKLPGADGLAVLAAARDVDPQLPVFLITAYATVETAIAALTAGARDYFPKPLDIDRVLAALAAAAQPRAALIAPRVVGSFVDEMIGASPAFTAALTALRRVAPTAAAVLLQGPSGTGKELFARALHQLSPRHDGPFVPFNCAAVPDTLVEAELFGYERGAFTGAYERKPGRIELANHGTLFLDEIGDLSPLAQAKLLRVTEEHRVERLGARTSIEVDFRLICATNRPLESLVADGTFREDLFYRINAFTIRLPALRERPVDIPILADRFLERYCAAQGLPLDARQLAPDALDLLLAYPWPGNIRELETTVSRAALSALDGIVRPKDLQFMHPAAQAPRADASILLPLRDVEKEHIRRVLSAVTWNKKRAAQVLQISRETLYRKIADFSLVQESRA